VQDASGAEVEDQLREAAAYNVSIYVMAGMPYLLLVGVGLFVYRGLKRKAAAEAPVAESQPANEGGRLCSPLSPVESSSPEPPRPAP
jgi:hypothetical protein